ncbi:MAG: redoxin domain-containing protein [Candidatus Rokubacteria bacterium]|nr:redoxin domain-containing protein [Candidatus Rokubacteria bacterium]
MLAHGASHCILRPHGEQSKRGALHSTDSPFSHDNWAKAVGISHYPLLSDVQRATVKDYGVYWPDWNANVRATFVVDKGRHRALHRAVREGRAARPGSHPRRGEEARLTRRRRGPGPLS